MFTGVVLQAASAEARVLTPVGAGRRGEWGSGRRYRQVLHNLSPAAAWSAGTSRAHGLRRC